MVEGRVTGVSPAGGFGHSGSLNTVFENLKVFGGSRHIDGALAGGIPASKPFFLVACFVKGREARLRKDQEVEIEIKKDTAQVHRRKHRTICRTWFEGGDHRT